MLNNVSYIMISTNNKGNVIRHLESKGIKFWRDLQKLRRTSRG